MAYSTVYDMTWRSNNASGSIELQTDGGVYDRGLCLVRESLEIRNVLPSWDDPIVRQSCSFSIINTLDDFFDIVPVITMSNDKWKVVVKETYPDSAEHILFEGFLNVETMSVSILEYAEVHFTASGYLSKLDNIIPSSINTIRIRSFIDIIADCLQETGVTTDIRVNSSLCVEGDSLEEGQTLFNKCGTFNEAFWENNIERMSALDIISAILIPFCCYLYRYDGYWYIERYANLLGTAGSVQGDDYFISRSYVEYVGSGGYGPNDTGTPVDITTIQDHSIHSLDQANRSQLMSIVPGVKKININVQHKAFTNAVNPDLLYMSEYFGIKPEPDLRQWEYYKFNEAFPTWTERGLPHGNIKNAVLLSDSITYVDENWNNGLITKFQATILDEDTKITLSWKIQFPPGNGVDWYYLPDLFDYDEAEEWTIRMLYYIKFYHDGAWRYIQNDDGEWTTDIYEEKQNQYIEINGGQLKSEGWWSYETNYIEIDISVPIGKLVGVSTSEFVFGIGIPAWWKDEGVFFKADKMYLGDIVVTVNASEEETIVTGGYSSEFNEEKDFSLELINSNNWNYRNVIRYGTDWEKYALYWVDDTGIWQDSAEGGLWSDIPRNLRNIFLAEKFRLYHLARQKQKFEYVSEHLFRPLQPFFDSKQDDKRFMLGSEIFKPDEDLHEVELWEYDNSTSITLTSDTDLDDEAGRRGGVVHRGAIDPSIHYSRRKKYR
jgi:hypothetical protein